MVKVKNGLVVWFSSITILVILLDQVSKYLVRHYQPEWNLKILTIHYSTNTGAAFSILQQQTWVLALISGIVAVVIIGSYSRLPTEKWPQLFWALFLGGVIGNGIDRALLGFVTDFLDFHFWPSFNVADSAITIAAVGLIVYYWKQS